MDLRQIEYIIAIEQEASISKAAEKLFITQSALNQQLLKLEKELGMPLFERKKRQMVPTVAGRIYLATAHQMMDMKQETYKIIHDIADETVGEIALAYTPLRGSLMFSDIYPLFHKRYPGITFKIYEGHIKKMEQLLLQKEVTLACTAYARDHKHADLEYCIAKFVTDEYEKLHEQHKKQGVICYENEAMGIYFISDPDGYWIEIVPVK